MLTTGLAAYQASLGDSGHTTIPMWLTRYGRTDAPLDRYRRRVRRTAAIAIGFGVIVVLALMLWVGATDGSPLVGGIPAAALVILIGAVSAWLIRVGSQWPHLQERRASRAMGVRSFAVGTSPLSRTYLVIAADGLAVVRGRADEVFRVAWDEIEILAFTTSRVGVGLSMGLDGVWLDIPLVLEVGGPTASAYSLSPVGARSRLLKAILDGVAPKAPTYVDAR